MFTCYSKIEHFSGTLVTIRVDGRDFRLPKELLCYNSMYFDQKLKKARPGTGLENVAYDLPYGSLETFELIIQWMYMSDIALQGQREIQPIANNEGTLKKNDKEVSSPENVSVRLTSQSSTASLAAVL